MGTDDKRKWDRTGMQGGGGVEEGLHWDVEGHFIRRATFELHHPKKKKNSFHVPVGALCL